MLKEPFEKNKSSSMLAMVINYAKLPDSLAYEKRSFYFLHKMTHYWTMLNSKSQKYILFNFIQVSYSFADVIKRYDINMLIFVAKMHEKHHFDKALSINY